MILVFGATGHIGGELISILSSEGVSAVAVARAPERARPIPGIHVPLSLEEARARMTRAGDPSWAIESLLALAAYQRAGGPTAVVHDTVQKILARPRRSLAAFVKDHAKDLRGDEGTPEEDH